MRGREIEREIGRDRGVGGPANLPAASINAINAKYKYWQGDNKGSCGTVRFYAAGISAAIIPSTAACAAACAAAATFLFGNGWREERERVSRGLGR